MFVYEQRKLGLKNLSSRLLFTLKKYHGSWMSTILTSVYTNVQCRPQISLISETYKCRSAYIIFGSYFQLVRHFYIRFLTTILVFMWVYLISRSFPAFVIELRYDVNFGLWSFINFNFQEILIKTKSIPFNTLNWIQGRSYKWKVKRGFV